MDCLSFRLCQRRCLRCFGFGKEKQPEVLLPTHVKSVNDTSSNIPTPTNNPTINSNNSTPNSNSHNINISQSSPPTSNNNNNPSNNDTNVWRGVPDPASVAQDKAHDDWNNWTEKAKNEMESGPKTREERQAKKIDNLFSMMEPKVIKQKKKTLKPDKKSGGGQSTISPRPSAGSRLSMGTSLSNTLGSLSDDENDDDGGGWGGDELEISDVKAVERDAIRKAREERRRQHEVERKAKKTELKGKLVQ